MAIRGRVVAVGQFASGNRKSDGQPWKKQEYVIETDGQYPKKVAFSVMNDKIDEANLQMGSVAEIEVDANSREYNGRWYTELIAWRIKNLGNGQSQTQAYSQEPIYQQMAPQGYTAAAPQTVGQTNDMPF